MSDVNLSVRNFKGNETNFDANSEPLKTKTLGINWSSKNDFTVPLQLKDKDGNPGPKIFLQPDQVDAIRLTALGGGRQQMLDEAMGEVSKAGISATVNGVTYKISNEDIQNLHGTLMN